MRLSENSHCRLQEFFRFYLKNERFELPKIQFHTGKIAARLTQTISVHGITLGSNVLILPALVTFNRENQKKLPEDLLVHEIMHVIQYREKGFARFLYQYSKSYWNNLRKIGEYDFAARRRAYLDIPFEIEAREAATEYLKWKEAQKRIAQAQIRNKTNDETPANVRRRFN